MRPAWLVKSMPLFEPVLASPAALRMFVVCP
jgi:hypothetical protein